MSLKKTSRVLVFLIFIGSINSLFASTTVPEESIPPYHWVNDVVIRLSDAGILDIDITIRPFTRGQVAEEVRKAVQAEIDYPVYADELLEILELEFHQEISETETDRDAWTGRIGANISAYLNTADEETSFDWTAISKLGVRVGPGLYAYHSARMDSRLSDDSTYTGKNWHDVGGYAEQGYLAVRKGRISGWIGRNWVRWGPGRSGALMLSDYSRPFTGVYASVDLDPFYYRWGAFELDRWQRTTRYMSAHRIEWNASSRLKLAVSEMMVYSGEDRHWEIRYINPVAIWQFEQWSQLRGNVIWGADCWWKIRDKVNIGAEVIIDDIQVDKQIPEDLEPPEIGGLIALAWADPFGIEGSRWIFETALVTQRTYKTKSPGDKALNYNRPIGWRQDNDVINFRFDWDHAFSGKLSAGVTVEYTSKGEDRIILPFDSSYEDHTIEEGFDEPFPTGTVARTLVINPRVKWFRYSAYEAEVAVFYKSMTNEMNNPGEDRHDLGFEISGTYHFDMLHTFYKNKKHSQRE